MKYKVDSEHSSMYLDDDGGHLETTNSAHLHFHYTPNDDVFVTLQTREQAKAEGANEGGAGWWFTAEDCDDAASFFNALAHMLRLREKSAA